MNERSCVVLDANSSDGLGTSAFKFEYQFVEQRTSNLFPTSAEEERHSDYSSPVWMTRCHVDWVGGGQRIRRVEQARVVEEWGGSQLGSFLRRTMVPLVLEIGYE